MDIPSNQPVIGKVTVPDDEAARTALQRFLTLTYVRCAAQFLAHADALREAAAKVARS
jgi:hypothetical protein